MRIRTVFILQLCFTAEILFLSLTVAHKDVNPSSKQPVHLVSDVAEKSGFQTLESSGNLNKDLPQTSGISGRVNDVCERGCVENEEKTSVPGHGNLQGGSDARIHSGSTGRGSFHDRIAFSSQQATELLVSSWNDLSKWAPRTDTSSVCERHVERAIKSYLSNELWALHIFDSWAKPGPSLYVGRTAFSGNFYQCREAVDDTVAKKTEFKGNYCVVVLKNFTNIESENINIFLRVAFEKVQLAVCLPDSCSQNQVTELFQERIQALNVSHFLKALSTDCRSDDREYTTFTYLAILLVLVIGTLTISGTAIDVAINHISQWTKSPESEKDPKADTVKSSEIVKDGQASQDKTTQDVWMKVLLSFSAYTNGRRFLSTSQPPGSFSVIPALRFFNMCWIVVGHTYFLLLFGYSNNMAEGAFRTVRYRVFHLISSMTYGVDSFFAISGFLASYLTVQHVIKKGWGYDWKFFFLHRYWRLTPTMVVTFVLIQGLTRFVVSGSMAATMQPFDKMNCEQNWWHILLYVNNLVNVGLEQTCFVHGWSVSADFQFYLLSPLMMIPFYYNKLAGVLSCLFFIFGQFIVSGYFNYHNYVQIGLLGFTFDYFKYCYCPFYSRIAPFAVGILTGYFMSTNNGRVKMSVPTVIIGWVVAITAGYVVIFGFHGDISGDSQSSLMVVTIYQAVSRTVWGAVICWTVVACNSGYGGPINAFLSWSPFVVLGRLTYIGYLVQIAVNAIIFSNMEELPPLNLASVVVFGSADVFFTCLVSVVLAICVELPVYNLERVLRDKK